MSTDNILDMVPYRHPFVLVDKIIELTPKKRVVGIKNISINDPYLQGHFPEHPIMPNTLVLEAISQTASALFFKDPNYSSQLPIFNAIKKATYKQSALPGDQLRLEVDIKKIKDGEITIDGKALVDGKLVCEAQLVYTFASKPSRPQIHPTASVHHSALLGKDVVIGPYSIVGENVYIGDNTILEAHVMVERDTQIGEGNLLHFGTVIGSKAQDIKYKGEQTHVIIGDNNEIREYVTINRASGKDEVTQIGSNNLLMTHVHIGHNCIVGDNVVIVNNSNLAGHCIIEDKVTIGGVSGIHQFVRVGRGAMIGAYTRLLQDLPPYMLCEGNPALVRNFNAIGLKRGGASKTALKEVKELFKGLFRSGKNFSQAMDDIKNASYESEEATQILDFCNADSIRGLNIKKSSASDSE